MNALYTTYIPAINAFINPQVDASCKLWIDVVDFFFKKNIDSKIASKADLAIAFDNANHPNYTRIYASSLEQYFDTFKISSASLKQEKFEPNIDFIEDNEGLRITFSVMRYLVYSKGERTLIEGFEFINKIYQTYTRYELAMMNRSKRPTHWTLIERIDDFTASMQPHIDPKGKDSFRTMNSQPKVYCIAKGTLKGLTARFAKYQKESKEFNNDKSKKPKKSKDGDVVVSAHLKFGIEQIVPIYETVCSNVNEEIVAFISYIEENYTKEFRQNQIGTIGEDGNKIEKITKTKINVKASKTMILINPDQQEFTSDMLNEKIDTVRLMLKKGMQVIPSKPVKTATKKSTKVEKPEIIVDITLFEEDSDGKWFMDDQKQVELFPRDDSDVSLIENTKITNVTRKVKNNDGPSFLVNNSEEEMQSELDDEDEDIDDEKEVKPVTSSVKKTKSPAPSSELDDEDDEDDEDEDIDDDIDDEEEVKPVTSSVKKTKSKKSPAPTSEVDDDKQEVTSSVKKTKSKKSPTPKFEEKVSKSEKKTKSASPPDSESKARQSSKNKVNDNEGYGTSDED